MNRFSQFFVNAITALQEPHLQQELNAQGQFHWHLYDPTLGEHQYLESEEAARAWFEQRFNHQPATSAASRLYFETAFDGVR